MLSLVVSQGCFLTTTRCPTFRDCAVVVSEGVSTRRLCCIYCDLKAGGSQAFAEIGPLAASGSRPAVQFKVQKDKPSFAFIDFADAASAEAAIKGPVRLTPQLRKQLRKPVLRDAVSLSSLPRSSVFPFKHHNRGECTRFGTPCVLQRTFDSRTGVQVVSHVRTGGDRRTHGQGGREEAAVHDPPSGPWRPLRRRPVWRPLRGRPRDGSRLRGPRSWALGGRPRRAGTSRRSRCAFPCIFMSSPPALGVGSVGSCFSFS